MKNYFNLIEKLAVLDRCHCSPEMEKAYNLLADYYVGTKLIKYPCGSKINHWVIPPYWECKKAVLKDANGAVIADKSRNNLEVYSYSPSFSGEVTLNELQNHLLSDPERPDATIFHFRNQYRHWAPDWGFSIPDNVRKKLQDNTYFVDIESSFSEENNMIQADFYHQGKSKDEFLFLGHFDHPSMVNDGLAGCIAAFEIINRIKFKDTKFSYRAFASVEIVGSVAYLENETDIAKNLKEALFLGFVGIESPLVYQQSYHQNSKIDHIVKHLLQFEGSGKNVFKHRELAGNDENIFDAVGYEIPTGTLMRSPFPEYHTHFDNIKLTRKEKIEEIIDFVFKIIHILENNSIVKAKYKGVPCLSNPDINLYMSPEKMSNIVSSDQLNTIDLNDYSFKNNIEYLNENIHLLYPFMNNVVRLSDGNHTILDICDKSKIPFAFGEVYIKDMVAKGLLTISDNEI